VPDRVMASIVLPHKLRPSLAEPPPDRARRCRRRDAHIVGYCGFLCMHKRRPYRRGLGDRDGGERRAGTRCSGPGLSPLLEMFFDSRCLEGPHRGLT